MRVEQTAAALLEAGAKVDIKIEPGNEHIITEEAVNAAAALLQNTARLADQNPTLSALHSTQTGY
jgi:hypothetical protein